MSNIITIVEHNDGRIASATLSALTAARQAAQATGGSSLLLVIGDGADAIAQAAAAYGDVLVVSDPSSAPSLQCSRLVPGTHLTVWSWSPEPATRLMIASGELSPSTRISVVMK